MDKITDKKILKWICPVCLRVIESIYPNQFEHNKEQHIKSHEKRENE